jgi:hypothetical protein
LEEILEYLHKDGSEEIVPPMAAVLTAFDRRLLSSMGVCWDMNMCTARRLKFQK